MSTGSLPARTSSAAFSQTNGAPVDRRRQWLIHRGILSPHPGPSRRLANLLPRKGTSSNNQSRSTSNNHSSADIHLEIDHQAVPVVVTRPTNTDYDEAPAATRTVSMPTDDASRMRSGALRQRPTGRRWISRDADRNASPPGRSRRFLMRLSKRRARAPTPTSETPDRSSVDLGCSQDWSSRDAARLDRSFHMDRLTPDRVTPDRLTPDRLTSGRRSLDNRRDTGATQTTTSSTRARTVYTVVDRNIPRHVLKGDAKFEDSTWNEYRDHIDELSEDPRFMDYLTAPVQRRPAVPTPAVDAHADSERIAVNKLYPLAFIRLLEAHAKYTAESYEPYNPEEEEHRYDDVDREDEGRVVRTTSTGVYDMGRFRAVGGSTPVSNASTPEGMMNRRDSPPAFGGLAPKSQTSSDMPQQPSFFQRISHERPSAIVPVC